MRPRIEPRVSPSETLNIQLSAFEIHVVHRGDFKFATSGRLDRTCNVDHFVVVEIETSYSPMGPWFSGFSSIEIACPVLLSNSTTP